MKPRVGLWIAIAALGVNAPRLVQAFLEADGLRLHEPLRPWLMGATGVAAALTLTGGGAWLAHELARGARKLQGVLLACWVLVLLGQLVLIPPLLMVEMSESRLGTVLATDAQRWVWAFTAVLLVDLVAAGAMVAQGRQSHAEEQQQEHEQELERIAAERNELERRLQAALQARAAATLREPRPATLQDDLAEADAEDFPCRNGCGWVGASQKSENAHQRYCKA